MPLLDLKARANAAGLHLVISAVVAALAAGLVFGLWYPDAFRWLSGGRDLFVLVTTVDVVMGPLLTLAVFNRKKPFAELRRDLAIIATLQVAALAYGMHTVYIVRPVALVHEVDRFRVITASDVAVEELPEAPEAFRSLPLTGPWILGTRNAKTGDERNDALFKGIFGVDISQRPKFWQSYDASRPDVLAKSRPVAALLERYPRRAAEFRADIAAMGAVESTARFLPVIARGDWVAILDPKGDVLGYLKEDGFF